eukprot:gene5985-6590_t
MLSSVHARHNIFTAEPLNRGAVSHQNQTPNKSYPRSNQNSSSSKRVSFSDEKTTQKNLGNVNSLNSPGNYLIPKETSGKMNKNSNGGSGSGGSGTGTETLPEIDLNVRQKLAMKDLAVKFSHKSSTLNIASNYGSSPDLKSSLSSSFKPSASSPYEMFSYDDDNNGEDYGDDQNSFSKISHASNPSVRLDLHKETLSSKHNQKQQIQQQQPLKNIMPNSYFFNDNHSVKEVEEYEETNDGHTQTGTEIEEEASLIQPHPKQFQSPLDAHRSFMQNHRAKNTLRSIKSLASTHSLPTEQIVNESKQAIVSMKLASKQMTLSTKKKSSPELIPANETALSTISSNFYFLTGLSKKSGKSEVSEDIEASDPQEVLGQKAPLESTNSALVERPLLASTFTRFRPHALRGSVDGENHATLLRSLDSAKAAARFETIPEGNSELNSDNGTAIQTPPASLYHIPSLKLAENGRTITKSIDDLVKKWTFVPAPEKPRPPPPKAPEPLTLQSLFGDNLIKADLTSKPVPEEELQRLLQQQIVRPYSNTSTAPNTGATSRRNSIRSDRSDSSHDSYFASFRNEQNSSSQANTPSKPSMVGSLPLLDLSPVQQLAQSMPQGRASYILGDTKLPSIRKTTSTSPVAAKKILGSSDFQTLEEQTGLMVISKPKTKEDLLLHSDVIHPVYNTENSLMVDYLSVLTPQAQEFMRTFLNTDPKTGTNPLLELPNNGLNSSPKDPVYQHSTTSFVTPMDIPSSQPRTHKRRPFDEEVFSERHLANIQVHNARSGTEAVIFLPPDVDKPLEERESLLNLGNALEYEEDLTEPKEETEGISEVLIDGNKSSSALLVHTADLLQPGLVLRTKTFSRNALKDKKILPLLQFEGNPFEDEGDQDQDGEKGSDDNDSPVMSEYMTFLMGHEADKTTESSFFTNYNASNAQLPSTNDQTAQSKQPAVSTTESSLVEDDAKASDKSSGSSKRVKSSQNLQTTSYISPSLKSGPKLDMRDEILDFLQKVQSPIHDQYQEYFNRTASPTSHGSPDGESKANYQLYGDSIDGMMNDDDGSTFYDSGDESFYPSASIVGDSGRTKIIPPNPSATVKEGIDRLRKQLEARYSRDPEAEYQMEQRVRQYLRNGVRENTQIKDRFKDEDDLSEW